MLIITGKAHAKINGKIENSTPCKIVTHEDFNFKLGTRDYVADITHRATFDSMPRRRFYQSTDTPQRTEQNLIVRIGKFEAEVTNNKTALEVLYC